jgi:acylphosphatase
MTDPRQENKMPEQSMKKGTRRRVRVVVAGRVQGVGFRYSTVYEARLLSLSGWVRNCYDGTVEILAEGHAENVEALLSWCRNSPPGSRVTSVQHNEEPIEQPLEGFEIRY